MASRSNVYQFPGSKSVLPPPPNVSAERQRYRQRYMDRLPPVFATSWEKDTCIRRLQHAWSPAVPSFGQSAVVSMYIAEIVLDGEIVEMTTSTEEDPFYFILLDKGVCVDLCDRFPQRPQSYPSQIVTVAYMSALYDEEFTLFRDNVLRQLNNAMLAF
jgi:hypothetical protein